MYDHVGVRVKDLAASTRFYEQLLAPLGFVAGPRGDSYAGFGPPGAPGFWLTTGEGTSRAHVAFRAATRAAVAAFHSRGLAAGGRDNGAPGPRPDYGPTYYAAFLIDLDGNNVEAVCHVTD